LTMARHFQRVRSDVRYRKMKYIYKDGIPGFFDLPPKKQEEIEKLARKSVAKPKVVLIEVFWWVLIGAFLILGLKWKPMLGEDTELITMMALFPLFLLRVFIHNTMIINPKIKDILDKQPNNKAIDAHD